MQPKVSITVTTYNHEPYIRESLDSILSQEVPFPIEVIVAEDCGTDGTRAIVQEYAARHPTIIRPLLREVNLGSNRNYADALSHGRGEFIANLDGDDFWTSPHKLARQVEYMESHPELMMSGHRHRIVTWNEDGTSSVRLSPEIDRLLTLEDVLGGHYIGACTMMFRREILPQTWPDWFFATPSGDWCLELFAARLGPIGFLKDVMADYRVHAGGIWRGRDTESHCQWQIELLGHFQQEVPARFHPIARRACGELHLELAWLYGERGEHERARGELRDALGLLPARDKLRARVLRTCANLAAPGAYDRLRALFGRSPPRT